MEEAYSLREISVLNTVNHPNVIQLKRVEIDKSRLHMVFEHSDCNLTDFMNDVKKNEGRDLSELEIKILIK